MKDRLEEFVVQHRADFDAREPDPSLWLKISANTTVVKTRRSLVWLRYAAAVAVLFAGFSAGLYYLAGNNTNRLANPVYQEVVETEAYYTGIISERYQELQPYLVDNPQLKNDLDFDMKELDEIYSGLKKDLSDNVANPEVIEAMIQQYRMKVEILEQLLYQLKEKENYNYENEKKVSL